MRTHIPSKQNKQVRDMRVSIEQRAALAARIIEAVEMTRSRPAVQRYIVKESRVGEDRKRAAWDRAD